MTWARTRTRANNVGSHVVKQDLMGIGANAAARVDREHSCSHAAIEKAQAELRHEIAIREKRRKELEFLEKGGNPLDFEYGESAVSLADLLLSETEAKEKKLFLLQNKHYNNGIVAELWKGHQLRGAQDSIKGQVPREFNAESQLLSSLNRLGRNGDSGELSKQILRRGTLPSIVRVKEDKLALPPSTIVQESKAENGGSIVSLDTKTSEFGELAVPENGQLEKVPPEVSVSEANDAVLEATVAVLEATVAGTPGDSCVPEEQKTGSPEPMQVTAEKEVQEAEVDNSDDQVKESNQPTAQAADECGVSGRTEENRNESGLGDEQISTCKNPAKTEDDVLKAARALQAARECSTKKPLPDPARRKSHWDFVLEEMAWMANDFMQERLWKSSAAAYVCRSAARASFWSNAHEKIAELSKQNEVKLAESPKQNSAVKKENVDDGDCGMNSSSKTAALESYAVAFLSGASEPPVSSVPSTPDVTERALPPQKLHFIVPCGATETLKLSVEQAWASKIARQSYVANDSEPDEEPEFSRDKSVTVKREIEGYDQPTSTGLKKKRKLVTKGNMEDVVDDDFSEFFDVPVKRQRTLAVSARQRSDKKSKKGGKPSRIKFMNKGTDSENEWVPEACYPDKIKRRKDHSLSNKMKDDFPGSKKARLSKMSSSDSALRKSNLRKNDFIHVSINQPGDGIPWSPIEDQAIVVLEHDFGPNWKLLSDILNNGCHLKGHFRSPKDCQDRHLLLLENLPFDRSSGDFPGIPKGTAMVMLQRLQGPMEEDTVKFHFEQILKSKQRLAELPQDHSKELLLTDKSHEMLKFEVPPQGGRALTPLEFYKPEQEQPSSVGRGDQQSLGPRPKAPVAGGNREAKRTSSTQSHDHNRSVIEEGQPRNMMRRVVQKTVPDDKEQTSNVKQEPVQRSADQHHHQQQRILTAQKQRNSDLLLQQQQPHSKTLAAAADSRIPQQQDQRSVMVNARQNLHQRKAAVSQQLPPCSTSQQQHQDHFPTSFAEHHQHPQPQPSFRMTPPNHSMMDPRIGMQQPQQQQQQQQQQQPNFHYNNHRCFSTPGPRFPTPGGTAQQWRSSSQSLYNQMNCLPDSAAGFQPQQQPSAPRFPANPRPMKQMQQRSLAQQQGQQQYLPSPGPVRYNSYPPAPPQNFHHPVYNGKTWQPHQQVQGNGGAAASVAAERSCLPTDATTGMDGCK